MWVTPPQSVVSGKAADRGLLRQSAASCWLWLTPPQSVASCWPWLQQYNLTGRYPIPFTRQWPQAVTSGSDLRQWPQAVTTGSDLRQWPQAVTSGSDLMQWPQAVNTDDRRNALEFFVTQRGLELASSTSDLQTHTRYTALPLIKLDKEEAYYSMHI